MKNTPSDPRTIVAIGGGGFSSLIDQYSLSFTGKSQPKVCFLPTASGDAEGYIEDFYQHFGALTPHTSHLSLTRYNHPNLHQHLLDQDLIYVGGGNSFQMLLVWRAHEVDKTLKRAWEQGCVMTGLSAGSICWFHGSITDSWGHPYQLIDDGLGLLPGSHCPHYDTELERPAIYEDLIAQGTLPEGVAIDDHCAVRYQGTERSEIVCSAAGHQAYALRAVQGEAKRTPLAARLLTP
jgi:peptidase E